MVTGNHNRTDAGFAAGGYGSSCFRTRWVDHTDQTHQGQTVFNLFGGQLLWNPVDFAVADCQNTQRVGAHFIVDLVCLFKIALDAAGQHHVESAFDDDDIFTVDAVDAGHQLAVGIERNLCQARILLVELLLWAAVFMSSQNDGGFGWVADVVFLTVFKGDSSVAAQGTVIQQLTNSRGIVFTDVLYFAGFIQICFDQGHAALGEGTGFIRADDRGTAQRFDGWQTADQSVLLDHSLNADGKDDGDDGRQTFRDSGNSQRYRGHKDFQDRDAVD